MKGLFYSTTRLSLVILIIALVVFVFFEIPIPEEFAITLSAFIGYFTHKQWTEKHESHVPKREIPATIEEKEWTTYITFLE